MPEGTREKFILIIKLVSKSQETDRASNVKNIGDATSSFSQPALYTHWNVTDTA